MAKGPAVVIIARHGARLDAADKQWHLTSPTPYDPPLTYGGWSQGRALGLRIAALLEQRENDQANHPDSDHAPHSDTNGARRKRKKHKVIIHSSPYLRCIQTSTAIAAGLSQYQSATRENTATKLNLPRPAKDRDGRLGASPLERAKSYASSAADSRAEAHSRSHAGHDKILLRIDAFLGEWLSPDYFEDITPPPNSTMMVAGAKADLLRRGDYVELQAAAPSSKGHFPGGWVKSPAPSTTSGRNKTEDSSFPTLGSLAQVLPGARERASSHGHSKSQGNGLLRQRSRSRDGSTPALPIHHKPRSHLYEAPVPSYAVSPADPIPRGYFSHARDACIDVDFQWDSMREPLEWGDGGEYGDEWSTMHKRFRKGLAGMMQWYKEHGSMPPRDPIQGFTYSDRPKETLKHAATDPVHVDGHASENEASEDEEELVLVLVTHGAGCNALLGAISNQPVLIDVGLAALSMAVRRDEPKKPAATIYQRRASVVDPGMSDCYEMKYLASTDHLRAGVDPSKLPQAQAPVAVSSPSLEYRRRVGYGASATSSPVNQIDSPFNFSEPVRSGWNSALGSMRRSSSNGSATTRHLSSHAAGGTGSRASSGLWSGTRPSSFDLNGSITPPADDMPLLNFDNAPNSRPTSSSAPRSTPTGAAPASPSGSKKTSLPPPLDGTNTPPPSQADTNGVEDAETHDNIAPLRAKGSTAPRRTPSSAGAGLWTPKNASAAANGLWGPPRMDDVYEHGRGPKRRWTVTEQQ